jgi:hypothetical protein
MINNYKMKRTFGIEIEFTEAIFNSVHKSLLDAHLSFPYKKSSRSNEQVRSNGKFWHLKYEFSTSDHDECNRRIGGELASPAMTASIKNFKEIHKCINILNLYNAVYNKNTGMHVHINIDDIDRIKFLLLWYVYEQDIYKIFPARINSDYAGFFYTYNKRKDLNKSFIRKFKESIKSNDIDYLYGDKSTALYFYVRRRMKFLEVRMGQMTTNPYLQTAWIKACLQMVEQAKSLNADVLRFLTRQHNDSLLSLNKDTKKQLKYTKDEFNIMVRLVVIPNDPIYRWVKWYDGYDETKSE